MNMCTLEFFLVEKINSFLENAHPLAARPSKEIRTAQSIMFASCVKERSMTIVNTCQSVMKIDICIGILRSFILLSLRAFLPLPNVNCLTKINIS